MKRRLLLFLLSIHIAVFTEGQVMFRGVVANVADSVVLSHALITVLPSGGKVQADEKGRFSLSGLKKGSEVSLAILAIGVQDTVTIRSGNAGINWILVNVRDEQLEDFVLHSLSAEDVVRKAVSLIQHNYAKTPYFCYSSYRQYQRMDSIYTNLVEARPVVMMNISESKGRLSRSEAYANKIARRTYFRKQPGNVYRVNPADLLRQDPIYHLEGSSLEPNRFFHYAFSFDTSLGNDSFYVVKYRSEEYSSERHGIDNPGNPFPGESWEEGQISIDRRSFAIRRFSRVARRHEGYHYPRNNNFVWPDLLYYGEFVDGVMTAEYIQMGERWYLKKLLHRFTDDFFGSAKKNMPNVRVTHYYEWQADSFSRYTGEDYVSAFYKEMYMWPQKYDSTDWVINRLPYHFTDSARLFADLERRGALNAQFSANIKPLPDSEGSRGEHVPQSDK